MEISKDKITQLENGISIDLSNMNLTEIPDLSIYAHQLVKLRLSHNKIKKIERLDTLTNLQILSLSENQITKIEGLDNMFELQILTLCDNQISKIEGLDKDRKSVV